MLHIQKSLNDAPAAPAHDYRLIYDWFAGWRWERHRAGKLIDESLQSFETRDECASNAKRHRISSREPLASVPADSHASHEQRDRAQLAA
jgi:hypothetical protein